MCMNSFKTSNTNLIPIVSPTRNAVSSIHFD